MFFQSLTIRYFSLLLVSIFGCFQIAFAQSTYSAIILDAQTNDPIKDVNVLVVNSSFGTFTDKNGHFYIEGEIVQGADLVYSHVNYEVHTSVVQLTFSGVDTIYLKPSDIELERVTIKSEKTHLKEFRLQLFMKDLFNLEYGKKDFYKNVDFRNSEAILFNLEEDKLVGTASRLLEFNNKYLGYSINCLLQTYERKNKDLVFTGKALYKDLEGSKRKKKKFNKRRKKVWEESQQKFFQDVISNEVDQRKFSCLMLNPKKLDLGFTEIKDFDTHVVPTVIDDVYALKVPLNMMINVDKKLIKIRSSTGIILLNKNGLILNKNEVSINGYWATKSLALSLPFDYSPRTGKLENHEHKIKRSIASLKLEAREIREQIDVATIEELRVQTDRFYYNLLETVYVSALLHDHRTKIPFKEELLVHFDLIDPNGKIIASKTKKSINGVTQTSFLLPKSLTPDQYGIRAYTEYMKNFNENTWSKATIAVNLVEENQNDAQNRNFQFTPEGGKLIPHSNNRVLVEIKNSNGVEIPYEGKIKDKRNNKTYTIKTLIDGLAILELHPSETSIFDFIDSISFPIKSNLLHLKPESGVAISVITRNKDQFKISIKSFQEDSPLKLGIFQKGKEIYTIPNLDDSKTYSISKEFLPRDILSVQLLDTLQNIMSERIIDNRQSPPDLIKFQKEYKFFYADQPAQINIIPDLNSEFYVDSLLWTVKITNNEYAKEYAIQNDLKHEVFLPIKQSEKLSETNQNLLRNYKLINNNTKIEYLNAYKITKDKLEKPNTNYISLSGQLFDAENLEKTIQGKVSITPLFDAIYYKEVETDEQGRFNFDTIPYESNLVYLFQARKDIPDDKDMYHGNRLVEIIIDSTSIENMFCDTQIPKLPGLTSVQSLQNRIDTIASFNTDVVLDEITIRQQKSNAIGSGDVKDLATLDFIPTSLSGQSLLTALYPSKLIRRQLNNPTNLEIRLSTSRGNSFQELLILLNGDLQYSAGLFQSLTADQIKYVSINLNVLSVITNEGFQTRTEMKKNKFGIKHFMLPQAKDYTDIDYINEGKAKISYRKTIYWNPSYLINNDSQNEVNFKTSNLPGLYTITASTIHPTLGYIKFSNDFEIIDTEK